jgi:hypothetical protein
MASFGLIPPSWTGWRTSVHTGRGNRASERLETPREMVLQREVDLLREMLRDKEQTLEDVRRERDAWRQQAQTLLLTGGGSRSRSDGGGGGRRTRRSERLSFPPTWHCDPGTRVTPRFPSVPGFSR